MFSPRSGYFFDIVKLRGK
uniref:Uncharacterized protein n=1 Tax=Mus musculus TaxID=10090 RepID=A0ABJ3HKJ1_MOUSE